MRSANLGHIPVGVTRRAGAVWSCSWPLASPGTGLQKATSVYKTPFLREIAQATWPGDIVRASNQRGGPINRGVVSNMPETV
ncbi:hypothetical protein LX36DRAFT_397469 [Colletotrichum falcatum]|nr:hypothetical protein LX36DRAFT_397469 [Colletotrichum falcatum]